MDRKQKLFGAGLLLSFAFSGAVIAGNAMKPVVMNWYAGIELPAAVLAEVDTGDSPQALPAAAETEAVFIPETAGPDMMVGLDLLAEPASVGFSEENSPEEADVSAGAFAEGLSSVGWLADYTFSDVDHSYFEDALFLGDSRTVGIKLYGGLSEPVYFANTGMSVFSIDDVSVDVRGYGKLTLNQMLNKKQFGKIYIMLGINELSTEPERILEQYQTVINTVRAAQPDALLYLCANLHVTGKKSASDRVFNNDRVNTLNEGIRRLADENSAYYIDVNEVYDDSDGNLSAEYASDFAHMYGRYYGMWVDWLCTKGIVTE